MYRIKRIGFNKIAVNTMHAFVLTFLMVMVSCKSKTTSGASTKVDSVKPQRETLFNGKDLSGWNTYLGVPQSTSEVKGLAKDKGKYTEPIGYNKDPLHVFSVVEVDGAPAIRISGEVFGILVTKKEYENYHLSLEFKWGKTKYPPRENSKRDSGVLYHSVGLEGAAGKVWMRSVEMQVQETDTGDLWCVDSTTANVRSIRFTEDKEMYKYDAGAPFNAINMRTERYCKKAGDYEKDYGAWNRLDIYAYGRESFHVVNGHINMHLTAIGEFVNGNIIPLSKGKIQLQSEGAEVFYRNISIRSIDKMPLFN
ncbi:3-keto-disaccharide hydrolase [Aestuariivivens sediminis]|uniref:3-keto-disaccharide hydrolase n=1 Tax=Aestuariivivens sediminis TaxID=2913557 RepID=UPI001F5710DD|nr:DUF1080 domain-containing protein [Aestuariivivens sediminis]